MARDAVTGAFGYTGRYIAGRLLALGREVITLTGHPGRGDPFGGAVRAYPFDFDRPDELVGTLRGVHTLYNTYWVRFSYGRATYDQAIENTKTLIDAAEKAGVKRFVHVSIANPSADSPLPYYSGKAVLEAYLKSSRLSYAIIRPTVIFGKEDILINNIAWLLRRFPFFAVPGSGEYGIQPVYVEDMAELAVEAGLASEDTTSDAAGPETFTFIELVRLIARKVGSLALIVNLPPGATLNLSRTVGAIVGDVVLTEDEVKGLMAGLLVSREPPRGKKKLSEWLEENRRTVGSEYSSEVKRHFR